MSQNVDKDIVRRKIESTKRLRNAIDSVRPGLFMLYLNLNVPPLLRISPLLSEDNSYIS